MNDKLRIAINMMYIASDIANGYAHEVEALLKLTNRYRHEDKHTIKKIKLLGQKLIQSVDKTLNNEQVSENFGDDSDFIRQVIELALKCDTPEKEIKFLSQMKINIR